jgi:cell division protein ZapB
MPNAPLTDQLAERIERLLVRYEELQRTNALLGDQVDSLTQERDSLKSRLGAARARVDALLERLPQANGNGNGHGNGHGNAHGNGNDHGHGVSTGTSKTHGPL